MTDFAPGLTVRYPVAVLLGDGLVDRDNFWRATTCLGVGESYFGMAPPRRGLGSRWTWNWRPAAVSAAQGVEGLCEEFFPGISRVELKEDAAHADAHDGADLEQLETDRIDLSLRPFGALEAQPA